MALWVCTETYKSLFNMNKFKLLFFAFVGVCSLNAYGRINVGAKLGLSYTNPMFKDTKLVNKKGGLGFQGGARVSADLSRWQVGIAADYATMSYTYESGIMMLFSPLQQYSMTYEIKVPMQPVYIFVNRKIPLPSSYLYFGLNAGHVFFGEKEKNTREYPDFVNPKSGLMDVQPTVPVNSFSGGIQGGYNLNINDKLSINAELAIHAIPVTTTLNYSDLNTWNALYERKAYFLYVPLSVGANYTF